MKNVFFILFFLLSASAMQAQKGVFKWESELCEHKGFFDSLKIQRKQIEGAYALMNANERPFSLLVPGIYSIEDLKKTDTLIITQEYLRLKKKFEELKLPALPVWEKFRKQQLTEIEEYYKMGKAMAIAAVSDDYSGIVMYKDKCSSLYSTALQAGGEKLLAVWKDLVAQSAKNNADPKRIWAEYEQHLASPEKYLYAKAEILTFGWGNCVNGTIKFYDQTPATIAFTKLFKSVKQLCSE